MNIAKNTCMIAQQEFSDSFDFLVNCPITNNIKSFKDFLNILASHSDKNYYFEIHPSKVDLFKTIYNLKDDEAQRIKVQFKWDTVRTFGTDEQKQAFNEFRRLYVSYLIQQFCNNPSNTKVNSSTNTDKTSDTCSYKVIGTPAISVESDMDFDIIGKNNNIDIGMILENISNEHHKYFALELDELFDTNLYGSVFVFNPDSHNNPSHSFIEQQNIWSWIRAVEILNNKKYVPTLLLQEFKRHLLSSHQTLFDKTVQKYKELNPNSFVFNSSSNSKFSAPEFYKVDTMTEKKKFTFKQSSDFYKIPNTPVQRSQSWECPIDANNKTENYRLNLSNYFANDYTRHFEDKTECFSLAKYYENETYRSLGAVLHIVNRLVDINKQYFVHSVYDQYGFVVENIMEEKLKGSNLINTIPKTAKYINRICDAIQKLGIQNRIPSFTNIKQLSEQLNNVRRTNNKTEELRLTKELQTYFPSMLNISEYNANSQKIDNKPALKVDFVLAVYKTLVEPVGIFQQELNDQQGGNKKRTNKKKHTFTRKTKSKKIKLFMVVY